MDIPPLDPADLPFPARRGYAHATWARTFTSRPELFLQPTQPSHLPLIVSLARRHHRRIALAGAAHSPSTLTCTSSWLISLDRLDDIRSVDRTTGVVVVGAGVRLRDLRPRLEAGWGLTLPNLPAVVDQSFAGAISTGAHGSCVRRGLLSEDVLALVIVLADGREVACEPRGETAELFRAALLSLGGLGIISEITFRAVPSFTMRWRQVIHTDAHMFARLEAGSLWNESEFVRVFWFPHARRAVVWEGWPTDETPVRPRRSLMDRWVNSFHLALLWLGHYVPRLLPPIERLVAGLQFGFRNGHELGGVQNGGEALVMEDLPSMFVNEWAIPLEKGPEAVRRLATWLSLLDPTDPLYQDHQVPGDAGDAAAGGALVNGPLEIRVSDTTLHTPYEPDEPTSARPLLDPTCRTGPTLFINATLYRPFGLDPPSHQRWYGALESVMRSLGGMPHWAKNFEAGGTSDDLRMAFGEQMERWMQVRDEVDPDGMFVGAWLREKVLGKRGGRLLLEEVEVGRKKEWHGGFRVDGEVQQE